MNRIIYTTIVVFTIFLSSCQSGTNENKEENTDDEAPQSMIKEADSYDPKRGEGKFSAENVIIGPLDNAMAAKGEAISGTKCTSCHKLNEEKLVGHGWKGVTERRTPHWIMNFITNPDPMIDKDPEVQALLESCLVRMPNQNIADEEARSILEFMRKINLSK
jgi:hypothetical protein